MLNKKNNSSVKSDSITGDWFFMSSKEVNVRMIYDAIKEPTTISMEIWEDLNILEIELSEKESIDFEPLKPYFKDEVGDAFLKEHQVQTLFMVTFPPEHYEKVAELMRLILSKCEGFFCADSEDFTPIIQVSE